jgi:hypothetical protein
VKNRKTSICDKSSAFGAEIRTAYQNKMIMRDEGLDTY